MKKILFLLLTIITVCSCYNDDDLWDKVNDLDGRVETLETTVKKMNSEITTIQSLVDALNQGKIITNTEQTAEGYTLTFNDGSKVSIKNGTNGTDAPVIGVKADENGVYYWTVTTNGTTEWLPDAEHKLRVTGVTPVMGVDSEGYWTVDTGEGAKRMNGTDGKPVKATGKEVNSILQVFQLLYLYLLIDGIAFDQVFFQNFVCPDAELGTALRLYTIADGDNHIQIINSRLILLVTITTHMCKFCTCDITFKFTFPIDIINMPAYNSTILLKQFCHLSLSQPHCFILQLHIN